MYNITAVPATEEQLAAGVVDPAPDDQQEIVSLLTFTGVPSSVEVWNRAHSLLQLVKAVDQQEVLLGGPAYLIMEILRQAGWYGVTCYHEVTERSVVEELQPDGSTQSVEVVRHTGFYCEEV